MKMRRPAVPLIFLIIGSVLHFNFVSGYGRLLQPASRLSMWRSWTFSQHIHDWLLTKRPTPGEATSRPGTRPTTWAGAWWRGRRPRRAPGAGTRRPGTAWGDTRPGTSWRSCCSSWSQTTPPPTAWACAQFFMVNSELYLDKDSIPLILDI